MIDLAKLEPFGRKQWVKKRFEEYIESPNTKAIDRSRKNYEDPTNELFNDDIGVGKWKATIDRKVNYLLSRPPVAESIQDELDELLPMIKDTARELLLRGSLIWIVQGDGESVTPKPVIMNDTMAVYSDEYKEQVVCFIRRYVEFEVEPSTGEQTEVEYLEVYYLNGGNAVRETYCYTTEDKDKVENLTEAPLFIQLGKTGTAPLYAYVEDLLKAHSKVLKHQDTTVEKNTKPLTEVRGYSGSSDEDLKYAIEHLSIARTDGNGGVTVHLRNMDGASIDMWSRRIAQEFYEATATVGKENEMAYAQSGKAMDRLFVDMENSARELAGILEEGLVAYFEYLGHEDVDIIWNTDRPVDDVSIISGIAQSNGLLSHKTLVEQHPWVNDPEEEMIRLKEERMSGMEDLYEEHDHDIEEDEWEVIEL